jgi:large subunit ribosomal protein L29
MKTTVRLAELRGRAPKELQDQLRAKRQELFNLRFQMATGKLENHREIQHVRRDLARLLGTLHERQLGGEDAPKAAEAAPASSAPAAPAAPATRRARPAAAAKPASPKPTARKPAPRARKEKA